MSMAKRMADLEDERTDEAGLLRCESCDSGGAPIKIDNVVTGETKRLCYDCGDPQEMFLRRGDFDGCTNCSGGPIRDDGGPFGEYAMRYSEDTYCVSCVGLMNEENERDLARIA
jgi:hypothetical protein